jgi:hypothetical protein
MSIYPISTESTSSYFEFIKKLCNFLKIFLNIQIFFLKFRSIYHFFKVGGEDACLS